MRKTIAVILILALFLLPGCGRQAASWKEYTMNPDGTLDKLRWGMTYSQAVRTEKSMRRNNPDAWWGYQPDGAEAELKFPDGTVLGLWSGNIHLIFRRFSAEGTGAPLRLVEIRVIYSPTDAEIEDVCTRAEACLTQMEPSSGRAWRAAVTLGDRISRDAIEEAFPGLSAEAIQNKQALPLTTAAVTLIEYASIRFTASGYDQALAELLGS